MKARHDAIVRNALKGGESVVVIGLRASHDLTASVGASQSDLLGGQPLVAWYPCDHFGRGSPCRTTTLTLVW
jgi:hypothetical protein